MNLNLSRKIMLIVATIIIIISLGLGITALTISSSAVKKQVDEALLQLAEEGAAHIDAIVNINLNNIVEVANRQRTQTMDWDIQYESLHDDVERLGFKDMAVIGPDRIGRYIKSGQAVTLDDVDYIEKAFQGKQIFPT
ncbi:MAG: hypothetical protein GX077_10115 [Tissierellia bacterium]|nr:hypothetical protein [Tissierellia bacterium]